jgi:hypothetical protein
MYSRVANSKTVRHSNAVAAGQTTITPSAGIDTQGYSHCRFIVLWGTITATGVQSAKVQQSSDDGVADTFADLTGTSVSVADDDDNKMTIIDINNPAERYLKCIISRATADSVVDGIIAILSRHDTAPTAQDSTVQGWEQHDQPAEGTA